jgi:hypothetical protein
MAYSLRMMVTFIFKIKSIFNLKSCIVKNELSKLKKWMFVFFLFFVLFSCEKQREDSPIIEKEINLSGFNRIYAGERFNLIITKGNNFYIKVKGPSNDVNDMEFDVSNGILDIQYSHYENHRPRVDVIITLPMLTTVNLAGAGTGTIDGFQNEPYVIRTILSGASKLTLSGTGINTNLEITGASQLIVSGATKNLYGNISGAGKLNAYDLVSTEVDISASGGSQAYVRVVQALFAEASGGSRIYYKGNPPEKHFETSGGGQVIHE